LKEVTIWTDGACSGNPGPGGWGAILEYKDTRLEMSGGEYMTTNNRMELTAAIEALESLKEPCAVTLYSDSEYMVNAMTKGWATGWKKRGWMKADKTPAKNPDLFEKLLDLCAIHQVKFIWVRGHAADENNNRCDELAVAQRDAHTR
jgi:ribonuclease HI